MGNGHSHVLPAVVVLRLRRRGGEAADARLGRRAEGRHAVRRVVGAGGHLVGRAVGDEAVGDGELGVLQGLLERGVLGGTRQLLVGGRGALCGHHAVATLVCIGQARSYRRAGFGVQVCASGADGLTRVLRETGAVAVALCGGDAVGAHRPPVRG